MRVYVMTETMDVGAQQPAEAGSVCTVTANRVLLFNVY